MIMNGIRVYKMTNNAYKDFVLNAKHCNNRPKNFIERKLSSLIHNATSRVYIGDRIKYNFCGFSMIIDDSRKTIVALSWKEDNHSNNKPPTKELQNKVMDTNIALGMDGNGNNWLTKNN